MRTGSLRHLVTIQSPVKTKSLTGAVGSQWELFRQVWANIETFKSIERQAANAAWPGADVKITMRYMAGLLPTMRIVYDDVIYSILGINDIEMRHREMELTCQSGVKSA